MQYLRFITAVSTVLLMTDLSHAATNSEKILRFPEDCHPIGYEYDHYNLLLKPTAKYHPQTVYLIKNISSHSVQLHQADTESKPYLIQNNNILKPNLWSVFATDQAQTKFICALADNKELTDQVVDCKKVLDICEFPRTKFGPNHRGNYWMFNNVATHREAQSKTKYWGVLIVDPKKPEFIQAKKG